MMLRILRIDVMLRIVSIDAPHTRQMMLRILSISITHLLLIIRCPLNLRAYFELEDGTFLGMESFGGPRECVCLCVVPSLAC